MVQTDPVVSRQAVQLHLGAAHSVGVVRVRLALHLVPVDVQVRTSEDKPEDSTTYCYSITFPI